MVEGLDQDSGVYGEGNSTRFVDLVQAKASRSTLVTFAERSERADRFSPHTRPPHALGTCGGK
jgi:hypothetical protein